MAMNGAAGSPGFWNVSTHTAVPPIPFHPRPPPNAPTEVAGVVEGTNAKHVPSAPVPWSIVRSSPTLSPLNAYVPVVTALPAWFEAFGVSTNDPPTIDALPLTDQPVPAHGGERTVPAGENPVPESGTVMFPPVVVNDSALEPAAVVVGLNVTGMRTDAPGGSVVPAAGIAAANGADGAVADAIVSDDEPEFATTNVAVAVVFTATDPKLTTDGVTASTGATPLKLTLLTTWRLL